MPGPDQLPLRRCSLRAIWVTSRRALVVALNALALVACHREQIAKSDGGTAQEGFFIRGGRGLQGEAIAFGVVAGRIVPIEDLPKANPVVDLGGRFVVPAFIDSHVHLSYYSVADALPRGGIVGAVDFAAPVASLELSYPIAVRRAGPMLTPIGGYPTRGWGAGGYGLEVASPAEAAQAVDRLLDAGADLIKVLDDNPASNPSVLATPHTTVWEGRVVAGAWP